MTFSIQTLIMAFLIINLVIISLLAPILDKLSKKFPSLSKWFLEEED